MNGARFAPLAIASVLLLATGCQKRTTVSAAETEDPKTPAAPSGTPVRVGAVTRANLPEVVSGPGRTVAIVQQQVRVPFACTLVQLEVADGDPVRKGDVLGAVVSRDSEAALAGAREMAREARTEAEKKDAARAVELAERNLVRSPLTSAVDGVVAAHAASPGDRLSEGQEVLTLSASDSIVFVADIVQGDLPRLKRGQRTTVAFVGRPQSISGTVHDVLPRANPADLTVPVRIDLEPRDLRLPVGLFGTAHLLVGEHRNATVVPSAAVLRDDVTGVARVAAVTPESKVHWIEVRTGLSEGAFTEITSPALPASQRLIVSGQTGLPEGAAVTVEP
ncbi:MAG: efflux RND transporter periplasmic adaptor subunit [Thermoanaerobaculia bacterium]